MLSVEYIVENIYHSFTEYYKRIHLQNCLHCMLIILYYLKHNKIMHFRDTLQDAYRRTRHAK